MRSRLLMFAGAIVALTSSVTGQSGMLGRKGRTYERAPEESAPGIRKLPQRNLQPVETTSPTVRGEALREYVQRMRGVDRQTLPAASLRQGSESSPSVEGELPAGPDLSNRIVIEAERIAIPAETPAEVASRWEIAKLRGEGGEFPTGSRYADRTIDALNPASRRLDPYNRNPFKGDFPILGKHVFLNVQGTSDTLTETRRLPTATNPSSYQPGSYSFFSPGESLAVEQHFRIGMSLFSGSAGFKPMDWEIKFTPEINLNDVRTRENGVTTIDVRGGVNRFDAHAGVQELYFEKRLYGASSDPVNRFVRKPNGDPQFDFASLRMGVQRFTSDFRGFVFNDEEPGARLFGTLQDNRWQYNAAMFHMLEKDANSGLNTFRDRHQTVYVANLYRFDALVPGYNVNFSLLYNNDQPSFLIDKNGFLIRPEPLGTVVPHKIRAGYAGMSGDGHIGRIGVSHAFYQAFGRDDLNPIASRPLHINAQLAAAEFSYESDWKKFKVSFFYTSGQRSLTDGQARGFDGIVPNQQFAGGGFLSDPDLADRGLLNADFTGGGVNFLNREAIPLTGTAVFLFGHNSLMPTLRPGLFEGQANFVNPGIWVYNAGFDAKVTPKWKATINLNFAQFDRTEVLEALLLQSGIHRAIGWDSGVGVQYRPKLNNNIVLTGGFGALLPKSGFENLFTTQVLYSGFMLARFRF